MRLEGENVLVTGAGGFIGSHLVEALVREGARVRAMIRYSSRPGLGDLDLADEAVLSEVEVVRGDVQDPHFCLRATEGVAVVFHLAALIGIPYSYHAPQQYVGVNVQGTLNLLEACRHHDLARLVHTSTSEVYGTAQRVLIDEDHPLNPQSPYAATKSAADQLALSYHLSFDLPVTVVRPFNTYGPRQSARAVVPTIASQLTAGRRELRLGSLDPVRDLTFVADTCRGFLILAEADEAVGRVTNLGGGAVVSIRELAEILIGLHGEAIEIVPDDQRLRPDKSEVLRLECDAARARSMGWAPTVSLTDGLSAVYRFVQEHPERFRAAEYAI
ncbi:MAG: GDP-mannose 4,6-dehydratase [Proteobacteria bacterium]|nr:GDP-mannose 4,6-dehydratase [Pseudomonadota bacterium]MBU1741225.1 GDP-mannose 4,6-dehydratase [Pseudomonadota bacterium]